MRFETTTKPRRRRYLLFGAAATLTLAMLLSVLGTPAARSSAEPTGSVGAVAGLQPKSPEQASIAPKVRSASCSFGGVAWRADYSVWLSGLGPLVKVDAVTRIEGGAESDAASKTWEWRLDDFANPLRAVRGPLRAASAGWQGGGWQSIFRSPRMVTPDGRCHIYLSPFANRQGAGTQPRVAVLGDSLLSSLNDPTYNARHPQGYVEGVFNAHNVRAEVEGQGGRRWTPWPGSPLATADSYLLDEFRGLVAHGVDGVVSALGANDAGSLAFFTPADQLATIRARVHRQLRAVLNEMTGSSDCVVAVTTVEHPVSMLGVYSDVTYPREARAINNIVRLMAELGPHDALRLYDFAAEAKNHQFGSPASWFISDNLHLNAAGKLAYTNIMWLAANQCVSE